MSSLDSRLYLAVERVVLPLQAVRQHAVLGGEEFRFGLPSVPVELSFGIL